jgi:hypothetical protein
MAISQISRGTLSILLLLVAAFAAAPAALADGDDVVALTESTFEKEVGQDRGALVEFYAPWFDLAPLFSTTLDCSSVDRTGIRDRICGLWLGLLVQHPGFGYLRTWMRR